MRPRSDFLFVAILSALASLMGCSSGDSNASTSTRATTAATSAASAEAAPTECAKDDAGDQPTVTIDVADDSDGFGRFGLKTPSPLPAGLIRLALNAVEDNPDPVSVAVTGAGASVFDFVDVAPGVLCGADLELAPGEYTVTFGAKTKSFTVGPPA